MVVAKKIINEADTVVDEMIKGYDVLLRADFERVKHTQVALISGGGSGHEPAHAGFIGDGMLTAAVCGGVFASPSVDSILATILTVTGEKGCLLIVKNYTGDRLNFGLAAEMAKAKGKKVSIVFVADDFALEPGKGVTGRRGLAGTVLVHKIAGATAKAGGTLEDVLNTADAVAKGVGTVGVSLSTCNVPGNDISERLTPSDGKMELGLGIHGEAGLETLDILSARDLTKRICGMILSQFEQRVRSEAPRKRELVVVLNNLGGTTSMEMFVLANSMFELFSNETNAFNASIQRMYVAPVMTSLEMAGFSITLMDLGLVGSGKTLDRLDASTNAPGWPVQTFESINPPAAIPAASIEEFYTSSAKDVEKEVSSSDMELRKAIIARVNAAAQAVVDKETQLTEWDRIVGDGDCGETFRRGALGILEEGKTGALMLGRSPVACFQVLSQGAMKMGGTSGAVLAIFFRACHGYCVKASMDSTNGFLVVPKQWHEIVHCGTEAISKYGGAKRGMRTLLDALLGLEDALSQVTCAAFTDEDFRMMGDVMMKAAKGTAELQAAAGRSNYLRDDVTKGVPDPGAMAVAFAVLAMLK